MNFRQRETGINWVLQVCNVLLVWLWELQVNSDIYGIGLRTTVPNALHYRCFILVHFMAIASSTRCLSTSIMQINITTAVVPAQMTMPFIAQALMGVFIVSR